MLDHRNQSVQPVLGIITWLVNDQINGLIGLGRQRALHVPYRKQPHSIPPHDVGQPSTLRSAARNRKGLPAAMRALASVFLLSFICSCTEQPMDVISVPAAQPLYVLVTIDSEPSAQLTAAAVALLEQHGVMTSDADHAVGSVLIACTAIVDEQGCTVEAHLLVALDTRPDDPIASVTVHQGISINTAATYDRTDAALDAIGSVIEGWDHAWIVD